MIFHFFFFCGGWGGGEEGEIAPGHGLIPMPGQLALKNGKTIVAYYCKVFALRGCYRGWSMLKLLPHIHCCRLASTIVILALRPPLPPSPPPPPLKVETILEERGGGTEVRILAGLHALGSHPLTLDLACELAGGDSGVGEEEVGLKVETRGW